MLMPSGFSKNSHFILNKIVLLNKFLNRFCLIAQKMSHTSEEEEEEEEEEVEAPVLTRRTSGFKMVTKAAPVVNEDNAPIITSTDGEHIQTSSV